MSASKAYLNTVILCIQYWSACWWKRCYCPCLLFSDSFCLHRSHMLKVKTFSTSHTLDQSCLLVGQGFSSTSFFFSALSTTRRSRRALQLCKQKNAHACAVTRATVMNECQRLTEEKKLFNKLFIFVFFADKKSILVATKHYGWTPEMSHGLF